MFDTEKSEQKFDFASLFAKYGFANPRVYKDSRDHYKNFLNIAVDIVDKDKVDISGIESCKEKLAPVLGWNAEKISITTEDAVIKHLECNLKKCTDEDIKESISNEIKEFQKTFKIAIPLNELTTEPLETQIKRREEKFLTAPNSPKSKQTQLPPNSLNEPSSPGEEIIREALHIFFTHLSQSELQTMSYQQFEKWRESGPEVIIAHVKQRKRPSNDTFAEREEVKRQKIDMGTRTGRA